MITNRRVRRDLRPRNPGVAMRRLVMPAVIATLVVLALFAVLFVRPAHADEPKVAHDHPAQRPQLISGKAI